MPPSTKASMCISALIDAQRGVGHVFTPRCRFTSALVDESVNMRPLVKQVTKSPPMSPRNKLFRLGLIGGVDKHRLMGCGTA